MWQVIYPKDQELVTSYQCGKMFLITIQFIQIKALAGF